MIHAAMLLLISVVAPGDVVLIQAKCVTDQGSTIRAICKIVIKSPIYTNRPVFLAQGWERSNHLADGMLVRAFVNTGDGVQLIDGTQMSDGGIWANDRAYERADPVMPIQQAPFAPPPPSQPPQQPAQPEGYGSATNSK